MGYPECAAQAGKLCFFPGAGTKYHFIRLSWPIQERPAAAPTLQYPEKSISSLKCLNEQEEEFCTESQGTIIREFIPGRYCPHFLERLWTKVSGI